MKELNYKSNIGVVKIKHQMASLRFLEKYTLKAVNDFVVKEATKQNYRYVLLVYTTYWMFSPDYRGSK